MLVRAGRCECTRHAYENGRSITERVTDAYWSRLLSLSRRWFDCDVWEKVTRLHPNSRCPHVRLGLRLGLQFHHGDGLRVWLRRGHAFGLGFQRRRKFWLWLWLQHAHGLIDGRFLCGCRGDNPQAVCVRRAQVCWLTSWQQRERMVYGQEAHEHGEQLHLDFSARLAHKISEDTFADSEIP